MSNALSRYNAGGQLAQRTQGELAQIEAQVSVAIAKMNGVAFAGGQAVNRAVLLQLAQSAAEQIAPNGSEMYAAIVQTATLRMIGIIDQLGYRLS